MKIELIIGFLCITAIVIVAMGMGYDGVLASSAFALIGGLLGWQGKKVADKKGGNVEATSASLKRVGLSQEIIDSIILSIKKGGK